MKFSGMTIGVPKEIMPGENRVSSTPETVKKMVDEGATVYVQKGAGKGAFFSDDEYKASGAILVDGEEPVFEKADVILKVKEPLFNKEANKHESDMLRDGQYLITFLHPAAPVNREAMKKLRDTGCISLTLDGIPRISRAQSMDALTSMSTVAGYKAKANVPSRIAFSVASGVDSRTILDMNGAEKLLGNGDMLFYPSGYAKPLRVQGAFVSDQEVSKVTDFLKEQYEDTGYDREVEMKMSQSGPQNGGSSGSDRDALFTDAAKFIIEKDKASIGMLQRMFKIGFNRAARIMDQLAEAGVVGEEEGTKPRKILMSMEEFEEYLEAGY